MMIRNILILIITATIAFACSNSKENKSEKKELYVAVIDSTMTLFEVAKANNIGEPYLRTKLGIPKRIGTKYDVATMAKRFKFTLDDLRKIIEDAKNDDDPAVIPAQTKEQ
jgi:hypothetical protein